MDEMNYWNEDNGQQWLIHRELWVSSAAPLSFVKRFSIFQLIVLVFQAKLEHLESLSPDLFPPTGDSCPGKPSYSAPNSKVGNRYTSWTHEVLSFTYLIYVPRLQYVTPSIINQTDVNSAGGFLLNNRYLTCWSSKSTDVTVLITSTMPLFYSSISVAKLISFIHNSFYLLSYGGTGYLHSHIEHRVVCLICAQ